MCLLRSQQTGAARKLFYINIRLLLCTVQDIRVCHSTTVEDLTAFDVGTSVSITATGAM